MADMNRATGRANWAGAGAHCGGRAAGRPRPGRGDAGRRQQDLAAEVVLEAYRAGLRLFGENRVEEAGPKASRSSSLARCPMAGPSWHMIGHLQSRKAADVCPWAAMVHSVDSRQDWPHRSDERAASTAGAHGLAILLEINVSGEESKYGLAPGELPAAVEAIAGLPGLRIEGLMTMAPVVDDPELARPVFALAAAYCVTTWPAAIPALAWRHLSMGMTDDFEVAIEEGATLVRIGRAIFGETNSVTSTWSIC